MLTQALDRTSNITLNKERKYVKCTLSGLLGSDFILKNIENKVVFQSRIFINNYKLKKNIINLVEQNNSSIPKDIKYPNSIIVNLWNIDEYECCKDYLHKGVEIEAYGNITYYIYKRFCTGLRIQLFFNIHHISKIKNIDKSYS